MAFAFHNPDVFARLPVPIAVIGVAAAASAPPL
jgi:hypothetical protein